MPNILLVEDEDALAGILEDTLTAGGYGVIRARNGLEATSLYAQETVDLVLTDLIMPDKEGMELIQDLRKKNPGVKIIAMSGGLHAPHTYLPMAQYLGAECTLAKPFSGDELFAAIRSVLTGKTGAAT